MISSKRKIKDGRWYNKFFPKASVRDYVVKKKALVSDTVELMQRVISTTLSQTKAIAEHLDTGNVKQTCKRIWKFCYEHIQYELDRRRTEQVRTPRRSWNDRERGIDCDCFTVLIGSILTNLNIPFVMRLWRNKAENFEHIYPVAFTPKGKEVIIDCVVHDFDFQAPYTEIKDIEMELHMLDGVQQQRHNELGDRVYYETDLPIDAQDLQLDESYAEIDGLHGRAERRAKRKAKKAARKEKRAIRRQTPLKERVQERVKNFGRKLAKVNPVTALMRAGILASMKLNLMGAASKLRFAYWSPVQARSKNMDTRKHAQVKQVLQRVERTFHKLGGNKDALRKAILEGKGNKNRMVNLNGLGSVSRIPSEQDDIRTVLGEHIIALDLAESGILEEGINGLGSVSLSAAVAAAAGFIGKLMNVFKKIGSLFKRGSKEATQEQVQANTESVELKDGKFNLDTLRDLQVRSRRLQALNPSTLPEDESFETEMGEENFDLMARGGNEGGEENFEDDEEFIDTSTLETDDNQKSDDSGGIGNWIKENPWKTAGIAAGTIALGWLGFRAIKANKNKGLSGTGEAKKKKKSTRKSAAKRKVAKRSTAVKKKPSRKRKTATKQSTPRIKEVKLA
ncbi:MAG: hypothetical protein Crog4KO_06680 [Crocinitomicaceae bacterium]